MSQRLTVARDSWVYRGAVHVGFIHRNQHGHWIVWDRYHQYVSTEEFRGDALMKLDAWNDA